MPRNKIEILAPAGGMEQLVAAVRCGADAVYLGTDGFNARANAHNFDNVDLLKAVDYCTKRNVAVHVTLNTLVFDDELNTLKQHIKAVAHSGADAVIVQDLATARLVRECCPDMTMHASTQMTIHNSLGANAVKKLGFSRAVLARELTLEEIKKIRAGTDIELEAFVHGALCTCVSGACYLSAMLGGRSGNRGCCAQPCRLDFKNSHGRGYAISLKDMSHVEKVRELEAAGVVSLKIEGRMKRPEYVAAAVTALRMALNGEKPDMNTLRDVFSREGFTDGYLTGKRTVAMYGRRKKEDAAASANVFGELASLYRGERQSVPFDAELCIKKGKPAVLTVTDGEHYVTAEGGMAEPAKTRATNSEDVAKAMKKTGGTPFVLDNIKCLIDDGVALPMSALNALRKDALEKLLEERKPRAKCFIDESVDIQEHQVVNKRELRLRFEDFVFVKKHPNISFDRLIIPIDEVLRTIDFAVKYKDKLIAEIPAILWENDSILLEEKLCELKKNGINNVLCGNIGAVDAAVHCGMKVHGDMGLNIINSVALEEYKGLGLCDATLSFETGANRIKSMASPIKRGVVTYGYLPLMKLRVCPAKGADSCGNCKGRPTLTDAKGIVFPLLCRDKKYTELLNSVPLCAWDKKIDNVDFYTLYFTVESESTVLRVLEAYKKGQTIGSDFTRGLYWHDIN